METEIIIFHLRESIAQFENRAMRMKEIDRSSIKWPQEIENLEPCKTCSHIYPHTCNQEQNS